MNDNLKLAVVISIACLAGLLAMLVVEWHAIDGGTKVGVERARACAHGAPAHIDKCVHP
jgi:hypothetical protein